MAGLLWPVHHRAHFRLSPSPISISVGPRGQSPFPSLSLVPGVTSSRKGGGARCGKADDLSFTFLQDLPLQKSPSSALEMESSPLTLSAFLGPGAKFPWGQGWAHSVTKLHAHFLPRQVRTGPAPAPACKMAEMLATPWRTCWVMYLEPNSS